MEVGEIVVPEKTCTIRNRNTQMVVRSPLSMSPDVYIELSREEVAVDESATPPVKVDVPEFTEKNYTFTRTGSSIAMVPVTLGGVTLLGYQIMGFVEALTDVINAQETDAEAPTVPTDVTATVIDQNNIDLAWSASTDNIGVAGYYVFQNGNRIASITETNYSVTGLVASNEYSFTVKAFDAKGNTSDASTEVLATTEAEVEPKPVPEE